MVDEYRMDGHKLIYHVQRVNDWLKGKNIAPIYMDLSITSACNHNCIFCGLDYARKRVDFMGDKVYKRLIRSCARMKVKSIAFAGEGEPLMHKHCSGMISFARQKGIDVALVTNAVLMKKEFAREVLPSLTWLRVSLDAGSSAVYQKVHRAKADDFSKVMDNIAYAVEFKRRYRHSFTVGVQFILLKENCGDLQTLARRLSELGVDYLAVKPYSKHPFSINAVGADIEYSRMLHLKRKVEMFSKGDFKVIFRQGSMEKRFRPKEYPVCYGLPFSVYVSADGKVYPCNTFLSVEKYCFGDLNRESFESIWKGSRRRKVMAYFHEKFNARSCREMCRLDEINKYLWQLKNPHPHVNFI